MTPADEAEALDRFDVALVRAPNPGALTLTGTNTWVVGRAPCVVVDPGPLIDAHVAAVFAEATARGGLGGVALTHDHADHVEALDALVERHGAAVPVVREGAIGPLRAVPTPGHSGDSVTWLTDDGVAFTGDAVLGQGSVFVMAQLAEYLRALRDLRGRDLALLCPGHGAVVTDPAARLDELVAHREDRERRLLEALARGARTVDALLDDAWSDAPAALRPAATATLGAHLSKLADEGRLPEGVQRP